MGDERRIVLASASPRRRDLLASLGVSCSIVPAGIDETERPGEDPVDYVERLAIEKAAAVAATETASGAVVIAADTTVDVDGTILAKPVDEADARRMLRLLSGRTHLVHTGVAVQLGDDVASAVQSTRVTMVEIDEAHLDWYVATGEPFGKAGAYALQGAAAVLVEHVDGSVSNVIGLPLVVLDGLLDRVGVSLVGLADPAAAGATESG